MEGAVIFIIVTAIIAGLCILSYIFIDIKTRCKNSKEEESNQNLIV